MTSRGQSQWAVPLAPSITTTAAPSTVTTNWSPAQHSPLSSINFNFTFPSPHITYTYTVDYWTTVPLPLDYSVFAIPCSYLLPAPHCTRHHHFPSIQLDPELELWLWLSLGA
jgi:hypothetical protein